MSDTTDTDTTTEQKRLSVPIAIKYAAGAAGQFSAYASTFGGEPDAHGDVVAPGAFAQTIADHRSKGTSPALLWSHDMAVPIGVITQLIEDHTGLRVDGRLTLEVAKAAECHALMKAGALAMSIGYRPTSTTPMGKGGRLLNAITLFEVSCVAVPSNHNARILSVKTRPTLIDQNDPRVLSATLLNAGYSRSLARKITFLGKTAMRPEEMAVAESNLAKRLIAASAALRPFSN